MFPETTGRIHRALLQSLHAKGFAVCVITPRQSWDFAKATLSEVVAPVSAKNLRTLIAEQDRVIAAYDRDIKEPIVGDADHGENCRILQSVPGIDPVTAGALICCMGELGTIGNRQASALNGVAPMAKYSGTMKGAWHIRGGRRRPRDVLCTATMAAVVRNPNMKANCRRSQERGKPRRVAVVAVMHRLIDFANAPLRDRRSWTERAPA